MPFISHCVCHCSAALLQGIGMRATRFWILAPCVPCFGKKDEFCFCEHGLQWVLDTDGGCCYGKLSSNLLIVELDGLQCC